MAETRVALTGKPAWVDLSSSDPAASREFYAKLFGWAVEVESDPQYGGYAMAKVGGRDVAGIGPKMMPEAPTAWSLYIGTDDVDGLSRKVAQAGGTVVAQPMDVGDQGRMAVFQDPAGAFIAGWQTAAMEPFQHGVPGSLGWVELNARGLDKAVAFYGDVFGWAARTSPMGEGQPPYTEFLVAGDSIAGGMEMSPDFPPEVPSYWLVYFLTDDVDATYRQAKDAGAVERLAPMDFPGGRFSILSDPQGATFGLLKMRPA